MRSKKEQREYKEFEHFLAFMNIAIKHTGLAIHREHSKQSMIMHLSDLHVRANIYFTTKQWRKIDRCCWQQRASHSKISIACLLANINEHNLTRLSHSKMSNVCCFAYINEQPLTRFSHSKISNAYDCEMGRVCHQFGHWHGTSC